MTVLATAGLTGASTSPVVAVTSVTVVPTVWGTCVIGPVTPEPEPPPEPAEPPDPLDEAAPGAEDPLDGLDPEGAETFVAGTLAPGRRATTRPCDAA